MKKGDLLECIANDVSNPTWKGILPTIKELYTCRKATIETRTGSKVCYVEEIISPIAKDGREFWHSQHWYRVIDINVNFEELLRETNLTEA